MHGFFLFKNTVQLANQKHCFSFASFAHWVKTALILYGQKTEGGFKSAFTGNAFGALPTTYPEEFCTTNGFPAEDTGKQWVKMKVGMGGIVLDCILILAKSIEMQFSIFVFLVLIFFCLFLH